MRLVDGASDGKCSQFVAVCCCSKTFEPIINRSVDIQHGCKRGEVVRVQVHRKKVANESFKCTSFIFISQVTHTLYTAVFTCIVFYGCWIVLPCLSHLNMLHKICPATIGGVQINTFSQPIDQILAQEAPGYWRWGTWHRSPGDHWKINVEQSIITWGWWN